MRLDADRIAAECGECKGGGKVRDPKKLLTGGPYSGWKMREPYPCEQCRGGSISVDKPISPEDAAHYGPGDTSLIDPHG